MRIPNVFRIARVACNGAIRVIKYTWGGDSSGKHHEQDRGEDQCAGHHQS